MTAQPRRFLDALIDWFLVVLWLTVLVFFAAVSLVAGGFFVASGVLWALQSFGLLP